MVSAALAAKEDGVSVRKLIAPLVIALLIGAFALFVYQALSERSGKQRAREPNTQVDLLPPPPPPPPPPPEEQLPPEPVEAPTPDPTPAPSPDPTPEAPAPMSIDAPATAGADAFGLKAGAGGGMGPPASVGTCIGENCGKGGGGALSDSFYRNYLSAALQNALRRDRDISRERFTVTVLIWVDGAGRVSRAELVKGSGNTEIDGRVLASIQQIASLRAPQPGVKFPQRTVVRGTRNS